MVSLVGVMHGTVQDFERIQWRGAENVAVAARDAGARLVHFSAIGADPLSDIPYSKTKGLGETAVRSAYPEATVIRPSLVFGPEDEFFNRFAKLARILPFLPVFGGGHTKFQPVYVGDLARAVELMCRDSSEVNTEISGKILEAGGPDVVSYRDIMKIVLEYSHRSRPIISLPWWAGMVQGAVLEKLPTNMFTITRDQVRQLQIDNTVSTDPGPSVISFGAFLREHTSSGLTPMYDVLPRYLK